MAYDKAKLEKKALAAIKRHSLVFQSEVVSYLPCSEATFYNLELEKLESIKEALEKNKVEKKIQLREKMYRAENPTAWISLYKLIGTEEEAERLNGSKQTHNVSGNIVFTWADKVEE